MASGRTFRRSLVLALLLAAVAIAVAVLTTSRPAGKAPRPVSTTLDRSGFDTGPTDAGRVAEPTQRSLETEPSTVAEQRSALLEALRTGLELSDDALERVRAIFDRSPILGQGNPAITRHPMTREECRAARQRAGVTPPDPSICGAPNMVPIYDPARGESEETAHTCIDQYEFPNVACEYPVVHVTAREAVELCQAIGKRICDAHEWEGACAGALRPPEEEYAWGGSRAAMTHSHNATRERVWAYGVKKHHALCATGSTKSPRCIAGGFANCGSNTYPIGAFPQCASRFGVYDQHGNAAEHMNLPLAPAELAGRGGHGSTEMKGSWFIFATFEAHEDDCRWRAPDWHGSKILDAKSHGNYHLGFRCCKSIVPRAVSARRPAAPPRAP